MRFLVLTLLCAVALVACGGGGKDGGNLDVGGVGSLSLSTTEINFAHASSGPNPAPVKVTGRVPGARGDIHAKLQFSDDWLGVVSPLNTTSDSASVDIGPISSPGPGTHEAEILVSVCRDEACKLHYPGSPQKIRVTYRIGMQVEPNIAFQFNAIEGATPVPQSRALSYFKSGANWEAQPSELTFDGIVPGWLSLPRSQGGFPGSIVVQVEPRRAGNYYGSVEIVANGGEERSEYSVLFEVAPLLTRSVLSAFSATNPGGVRQQTLQVRSADPGREVDWQAVSGVPWLKVETPAGNTGSQPALKLSVDEAELPNLENGLHSGFLTIGSSAPLVSELYVQTEVTVDITRLTYVAPRVAPADAEREVMLHGHRLDESPIAEIRFGAIPARAWTLVAPKLLRVRHPALAPGRYPVTVKLASGVTLPGAPELVVQASSAYGAAGTGPGARFQTGLLNFSVFDAERGRLYVPLQGSGLDVLELKDGAWLRSVPIADEVNDVDLAADGAAVYVATGTLLRSLSPLDWSTVSSLAVFAPRRNLMLGDGRLLNRGLVLVNPRSSLEEPLSGACPEGSNCLSVAPPTGEQAVIFQAISSGSVLNGFFVYSLADGSVRWLALPVPVVAATAARFGKRWALQLKSGVVVIMNDQFEELGRVPFFQSQAIILNGDGSLLYGMYRNNSGGYVLKTYDLTKPEGSGFAELPELRGTPSVMQPALFLSTDESELLVLDQGVNFTIAAPRP